MLTRRHGFTLVELLVAMVLLALVGGAIVTVLLRQQQFYNSTHTVLETRQQIRQAAAMLPSDLRGISSVGGDIYAMTDSSIEFRSAFGTGIVCITTPATGRVNLVPLNLLRGSAFTTWFTAPVANDSVAIYDDGATFSGNDDVWRMHGITTVTALAGSAVNCPNTTGLAQPADLFASNTIYQLTLSPVQTATIRVGAAVRFFRKVHYSLYRNAADGLWYLGFYDCKFGRTPNCNAIQPIAGPLNAYSAGSTSGLQLTYYDSLNVVTAVRNQVARISLVARGQSSDLVNLTGGRGKLFGDSIRIEVGLRNRK